MKVKTLISILNKVIDILEVYEDRNLNEMLSDIYSKVATNKGKAKKHETKSELNISDTVSKLQTMTKGEIIEFLSGFQKKELLLIGKAINLKHEIKDSKDTIIDLIANRYGFIRLHEDMGNRSEVSDETPYTVSVVKKEGNS